MYRINSVKTEKNAMRFLIGLLLILLSISGFAEEEQERFNPVYAGSAGNPDKRTRLSDWGHHQSHERTSFFEQNRSCR